MATATTTTVVEQVDKAFQKQRGFSGYGPKKVAKKGKGRKTASLRYYKSVGLGIKTPKEAIEGTYIDKKCPFTGQVSIRGRILKGVIKSAKMKRTVIIRRDFLHYITKYNRFEKRHNNLSAHLSPCFRVKEGDWATVGECRPLSKTVSFNVLKVDSSTSGSKGVKLFQKF